MVGTATFSSLGAGGAAACPVGAVAPPDAGAGAAAGGPHAAATASASPSSNPCVACMISPPATAGRAGSVLSAPGPWRESTVLGSPQDWGAGAACRRAHHRGRLAGANAGEAPGQPGVGGRIVRRDQA